MGRYYSVELENKSDKNIEKINDILKNEFNVYPDKFEDDTEDVIFRTKKWLNTEWEYVKNAENYNDFSFSTKYKPYELTFSIYKKIRKQWGDKIGHSIPYRISYLQDDDENDLNTAKKVYGIALMVNDKKYSSLFKIKKLDNLNVIKQYINHLIKIK